MLPGTLLTLLLAAACGGPETLGDCASGQCDGISESASGLMALAPLAKTNCTYDMTTSNKDGVGNVRSCGTDLIGLASLDVLQSVNDVDFYYLGYDSDVPNEEIVVTAADYPIKCEIWDKSSLTKKFGTSAAAGGKCDLKFSLPAGQYYFLKLYADTSGGAIDSTKFTHTLASVSYTDPKHPATMIVVPGALSSTGSSSY